ncbi:CB1 cannabinoid receptor-interacting protein 1-like [Oppia nitens]|uniref:CB1 cannabinoid receptor-interacting protein 1-like n=1 Tax=Oppia nitens TaxID=1686743 RepID=UPI0023DCE81B|nr:CB1 cannabinoid receptor-interacting protein 1-like [Oppia nitens]
MVDLVDDRNSYKIELQIKNKDDNDIYYKRDGQRFDSEYTLKFMVENNYEFTVTVKPSLPLQSVSVQGSGVSVTDKSQENGSSTYLFSWDSTKIDANKKKDRNKVQLLLQFQGGLTLVIPLQVKFYKSEDTQHLTWGTPLHHIDYECRVKPGQTYVDIIKTIFR